MFLKKQVFESVISSQASCRCVLNHNLKEKALNCLVLHQIILKIPRKLNMRISESLNDNLGWLVFYLSQNDLKPPTSLFIMFFSGILLIVLGLKRLECCGDSIFLPKISFEGCWSSCSCFRWSFLHKGRWIWSWKGKQL